MFPNSLTVFISQTIIQQKPEIFLSVDLCAPLKSGSDYFLLNRIISCLGEVIRRNLFWGIYIETFLYI